MSDAKKNLCKRLPLILLALLMVLTIAPAMLYADDSGNEEESTFQNPNQVQKAERVAKAAALNSDDPELAERVEILEREEQELKKLKDDGLGEGDPDYDEQLERVEIAEKELAEYVGILTGEAYDDIIERRAAGDGWGEIVKDLGLHPSILGNRYGQRKAYRHTHRSRNRHEFEHDGEISATTTRSVKTGGWAKGHGKLASGQGRGKGSADSFDMDAPKGKSEGKSNGKGGGKKK